MGQTWIAATLRIARTMWRQPPRLSRKGEAERPRPRTRIFFLLVILLPAASHALPWTLRAQPTRLLNGAPVLFQVKPPQKLNSLTGKWQEHDLVFSYDASTRTWFALAGVSFATAPGKYPLELTGESAKTQSPLRFTGNFTVFRANYPKIRVPLAVEKKYTEPSP